MLLEKFLEPKKRVVELRSVLLCLIERDCLDVHQKFFSGRYHTEAHTNSNDIQFLFHFF